MQRKLSSNCAARRCTNRLLLATHAILIAFASSIGTGIVAPMSAIPQQRVDTIRHLTHAGSLEQAEKVARLALVGERAGAELGPAEARIEETPAGLVGRMEH